MATTNNAFVVKNGLVVNGNLITANNGQVGINNASPDANVTITGTANVQGNAVITGTAATGNLTVTGFVNATTVNASANVITVNVYATTINATANVQTNSVFATNVSATTVTANLVATQINSVSISVTGGANVGGIMNVVGNAYFGGANVYIAGNLVVSGTTTSVGTSVSTGSFIPGTNATYTLGTSANTWLGIYGVTTYSNVFSGNVANLGANLTVGTIGATNGALITNTSIVIGNGSVNAAINSTSYTGFANLQAYVVNTSAAFTLAGIQTYSAQTNFNANVAFGTSTFLYANGVLGASQVLTSNATGGVYWSTVVSSGGSVTSITAGNGLTATAANPIVSSGTITAVAANGITVTAAGINVNGSASIVSNTTGTWANLNYIAAQNIGAAANATNGLGISGIASNANTLLTYTWNAPGAIGATTANTGAFTQLTSANLTTSTNVVTIGTGTYFVSNGNIGVNSSTPSNTLYVVGTGYISGNTIVGGNFSSANVTASGQFIGPATGLTGTASSLSVNNAAYLGGTIASSYLTTSSTYSGTLTSSQVTTALTYTPYNSTNPAGYVNSTSGTAGTANNALYLGGTIASSYYTTSNPSSFANSTNGFGINGNATNITGTYAGTITSSQVTTGLGFTPYNATNPAAFANATNGSAINGAAGSVSGVTLQASLGTAGNPQFNSIGVGTAATSAAGEIRATNNVTGYYSSDIRLKTNITNIANAMFKVSTISGVEFDWTDEYIEASGGEDGYFVRKHDVGVIAQEIQKVLPEVVGERDNGILAVKYERIVPLLIEAIKELKAEIDELKAKVK